MSALGLSLDSDTLLSFWRRFDPELAELVSVMDRAEGWTLDRNPAVAERLIRLGQRITGEREAKVLVSAEREDLLLFLAYISTSRALRVIHWLDEVGGYGSALVDRLLHEHAEVTAAVPEASLRELLTHRLRVISNTPFFTKLFAPERLQGLGRAIHRHRQEAHDGE
ncbi:MAG: hypothetical protein ACRDS9_27880 [Pseudonocardiaceae bacterium]